MAYYEIFNGIVSSIAASAIIDPVKTAVHYYMHKNKVSDANDTADEALIAIPLAIGYYYNLIKKLEAEMGIQGIEVQKHIIDRNFSLADKLKLSPAQRKALGEEELRKLNSQMDQKTEYLGRFFSENISLELLYPKDLSNSCLRGCADHLRAHTCRASIESNSGGRPYGFNYREDDNPEKLRIVDYVRPVEVIPRFYKEIRGLNRIHTDNEEWRSIEEKEMQAFLYTLKHLVEENSEYFYNKTSFCPAVV